MTAPSSPPAAEGPAPMPGVGRGTAVALVFGASAAVLVVEIAALRLLAPYLGLTLETSTLVIGLALGSIALGSWAGGRVADRVDPRRLIAPALGISGVVVALTPSLLRASAALGPAMLVLVASLAILVPGALLSAVTPIVTKLRLTSLDETGAVVGRLSGIGTLGAIVGTVLTGFVLISRLPVTGILLGLAALLVAASVLVGWRLGASRSALAVTLVAVLPGGLAAAVVPDGCDAETRYHCVRVVKDPGRDNGWTLVLDNLRHSYLDLDDPTHLEFAYIRAIASAVDASYPEGEPLRAYHLGGGGLTVPRYLTVARPGTDSLVSEIDGGVVSIDRDQFGLASQTGIEVRVEDGRLGLRRLEPGSRELIVGDAFGGVSVPWHLTTREAIADVDRVLTADGVYVANVIDHGDLAFARAKVATLAETFDHLAIAGEPIDVGPDGVPDGGNMVIVASDRQVDLQAMQQAMDARDTGWTITTGDDLVAWVGDARVLTDDHAPVDQLLEPYAARRPAAG